MPGDLRDVSPMRMFVMIVVFPLVGPIVGALLFVVLFTVLGVFTMGPASLLVGLMYFFFWLPALYGLFGVPFLLTGVLYALAVRWFAPESFLTATVAALGAFAIYLGARYLVLGSLETPGSPLGPNALSSAENALGLALVGIFPCWWLIRDRNSPRIRWW